MQFINQVYVNIKYMVNLVVYHFKLCYFMVYYYFLIFHF